MSNDPDMDVTMRNTRDADVTTRGFTAGQRMFGRYELVRLLGRGGMGVVWLAKDEKLERQVALKFLPEMLAKDVEAVRDLKRETRRALDLTHARIVRIYDFVEDAQGAAISMEYIEGVSLAALILGQPAGHFEVAQLRAWMEQLCGALGYAHDEAKVVHRDLKPANLMIDRNGTLKVMDFGISATLTDTATRVSQHVGSSGTPLYMSPQQMMGKKPSATDDVYSLGATLYELLTGKPPFYTGNIFMQVKEGDVLRMGERRAELDVTGEEIPVAWEDTVRACLAKDPGQRPQSAAEVWAMLNGAAMEPRALAVKTPASKPAAGEKGRKISKTVLAALAACVLALAGMGYYFGVFVPERERAEIQRRETAERVAAAERERLAEAAKREAELKAEAERIERERVRLAEEKAEHERKLEAAKRAAAEEEARHAKERTRLAAEKAEQERREEAAKREAALKAEEERLARERVRLAEEKAEQERRAAAAKQAAPEEDMFAQAFGGAASEGGAPAGFLKMAGSIMRMASEKAKSEQKEETAKKAVVEKSRQASSISSAKRQSAQPSGAFTVPELNMEMVLIAPGTFKMGYENGGNDEQPVHTVRITRPFWLGKYEVTQGQWEAFMANNPSKFKKAGKTAPVECVSWEDAMSFCRKLTEQERRAGRLPEGYAYTLPTEAQWEYACRAGTTGEYLGNLDELAWYKKNSGGRTHPVGQKAANAWGLHDMCGNVAELCLDWKGDYPSGIITDPVGPATGSFRIDRGGCYSNSVGACRAGHRGIALRGLRTEGGGFRVALSVVSE